VRRDVIGVVALLLAAAAVLTARSFTATGGPPRTGPALSPRDRLLLLADVAGPAVGDASAGRYSRIHIRRWVRTGDRFARWDSERWRAPDGSGRLAERRLDSVATLAEPFPAAGLNTAGAPSIRTDYPAGSLRLRVGEPFPATAGALLAAFGGEGPTAVTAGLLDSIGIRYLDRAERAAVLRVFAGLPGLTFVGAGALGLGFGLDLPGVRLRLLVDAVTGEVVGWQHGDAERVLVLDRTRVARLPTHP
jgi:hypothetical protein